MRAGTVERAMVEITEGNAGGSAQSSLHDNLAPVSTPHSADYLRRLTDAIDEFTDAFEWWMETQVESNHLDARGLFPTVWNREDVDEGEVKKRSLAVAEAAGVASSAVPITGAYVVVHGVGRVDPIANWFTMSQPKTVLAPSDVRSMAATIRGRLRAMTLKAEADGRAARRVSVRSHCTRPSGQRRLPTGPPASSEWQSARLQKL